MSNREGVYYITLRESNKLPIYTTNSMILPSNHKNETNSVLGTPTFVQIGDSAALALALVSAGDAIYNPKEDDTPK